MVFQQRLPWGKGNHGIPRKELENVELAAVRNQGAAEGSSDYIFPGIGGEGPHIGAASLPMSERITVTKSDI